MEKTLEQALVDLIDHGRARCGSGFGNFAWGILEAVEQLKEFADTPQVNERLRAFKKRLED